jgi:hypothetical protein
MKIAIKKIGFFFLLLVAIAPLFYTIFLQINQYVIRHRMKERLEDQLLVTITIAENKINWIKPGKEISVNGSMFDIKSYNSENGHVTFTGLYDDDETALTEQLQKKQEKNSASDNELFVQLFQLLQDVYDTQKEENFSTLFTLSLKSRPDASSLCSRYVTILTPPPQF